MAQGLFLYGKHSGKIPMTLSSALARKLDIINAAVNYQDLRSSPGNRYEELNPTPERICGNQSQ